MSLSDPALGFFHRKPTVRVVVIGLWCLAILFAFLTSWTAGAAAFGWLITLVLAVGVLFIPARERYLTRRHETG